MNTRFVSRLVAIGALALTTQAAWATTISFNDMSPQARQVAQSALSSGSLNKVESVNYQGRQIYALTFKAPSGSNRYLYLNPDGTYVANLASTAVSSTATTPVPSTFSSTVPYTAPSTVPLSSQTVQMSQVPQAVQSVIQTELKNGPVSQILQLPNSAGSGVMYEVFFSQPNGQQKIIYLNPDGTYVQNNNSTPASPTAQTSTFATQPLLNAAPVSFGQLPAAVQNSFQSEASGAAIRNVLTGQWNGQTIYQADIKKNGQFMQMRVDPSGAILGTSMAQSSLGFTQP